ncbi:MAG: Ig-like domain repeat protein [Terriglobia bacterium]
MCTIVNPSFDKETPPRIGATLRSRVLPIRAACHGHLGLDLSRVRYPRHALGWAQSARPGFVFLWGFLLSLVAGCLLLGAAPTAYAQVSFNGVASIFSMGGIVISNPADVVVDGSGNVYIANEAAGDIVKVNPQGVASLLTISGLSPGLSHPSGIALDSAGTLYITDHVSNRVVRVSPSGSGSVVSMGSLALNDPLGIAVDASGNLFIADTGNNRIVEVPSGGAAEVLNIIISPGPAKLNGPAGLAVNSLGTLYIADSDNNRIVVVAAGGGAASVLPITGLTTGLNDPSGVAVDGSGNVYIADTGNSRIVMATPAGASKVLSTGAVRILNPSGGVGVDTYGTVSFGDAGLHQVVKVATSAVSFGHVQSAIASPVTQTLPFTVASGTTLGAVKAFTLGTESLKFNVVGSSTCIGATDQNCTVDIQYLSAFPPGLSRGAVVLYDASTPPQALISVPLSGFTDASLAALAPNTASVISTGSVALTAPGQIALDGSGNMYIANYGAGNVVKVAIAGSSASVVNTGGEALNYAGGATLDGAGNLFVSDSGSSRIVVVTPAGVASELSISGLSPALNNPMTLTFDAAGNLYIADQGNGRIVNVSSLVVGATSTGIGSAVATGSYSLGSTVSGVAVDAAGTVYIADTTNNRIVKVTATGSASLVSTPGLTLSAPQGVAVDGMNNVYIADSGNARIVQVTTAGIASVVSLPGLTNPSALNGPAGITVDPFGNVFILDTGNNRIVESNVSGSSLAFPSTKVGSASSPQAATVTNLGNQPLVFAANPAYPADFSQDLSDNNPCTSGTSLSAGTACGVSVKFKPQSAASLSERITLTNNSLNVVNSMQQVLAVGSALDPADTTATAVSVIPSTLAAGQTVTVSAVVSDTASGHTSIVPTGQVSFTDTVGSTLTSLNNGLGVNLTAGQASLTGVVLRGVGVHTITAVYGGATDAFLPSTGTTTVTLNQSSVTLTVQPAHAVFGQTGSVAVTVTGPYTTIAAPSGTISYSILNASSASVASGTITLTLGSTSSTATLPVPNTLPPGSYTVSVTYSGDSNYMPVPTATPVPLTVNKASPAVVVASSLNPVLVTNPVTFTATVSSAAATPTGSVSFADGQTPLGSAPLAQGVATFTTSSLTAGTHSITAIYSGDDNFASVTSAAITQTVGDFTLSISSSLVSVTAPTVLPGGVLNYVIQMSPTEGSTFPSAIAFSTSGLPAGATATFTPSTLAAGSPSTSVGLAFQFGQQIVALPPANPLGRGFALAMIGGMLLLPFGKKLGRSRGKAGRLACLLLLVLVATGAALSLAGCGGTRSGYFAQQARSFTVAVTATSGALSHSTTVNFILE